MASSPRAPSGSAGCGLFARTRKTLLNRLLAAAPDSSEADWERFFEIYYPAMVAFAARRCGEASAEDVAQGVMVRLVAAFREGRYRRLPGKPFRAYLVRLLRNALIDHCRAELARGAGVTVPLDDGLPGGVNEAPYRMDADWRQALHQAAVDHVLTRMAISPRSRDIYRALQAPGATVESVAADFGISRNAVSQARCRIDRRIAAVESFYENEEDSK